MTEPHKNDDIADKIQIFSNTDERMKFLGKMLNSDSSMNILHLLNNDEMTANEIAETTKMSLPLVIHHLNTMSQAGIVNITKTRLNSKNQPMKCYTAKTGILILPEQVSRKAKESKSLSNSLQKIMRFSVIGVAGLVSWLLIPKPNTEIPITTPPSGSDNAVNNQSGDFILDVLPKEEPETKQLFFEFWADSTTIEPSLASIIIPIMIVVAGVVLDIILARLFRKKHDKLTQK